MTLQLVDSQGGGTHPLSLKAVYPPNLPDFSLTNASIATFEAARSSLHDCNSTHTSCKDRKPSEIWPTRLIDVGSAGNDCLRVVTLAQPQLYCATSHCWGNHANHLQLNRDTYTRLVSGFSFYELPRLYADFVIAARQLGVQYLWVDSLCIIQDNKDDWEYEARRMADVYQGSYCTLAATSAQNSDDSLFLKTSPLCNISYVPKGVQNWGLVYPRPGWFQNSTSATFPLHKRAWVFQETLLSPRQLHFGFGGVSFTCRQIGVEPSGEFFPPQIVQSWRDLLRTKNYKLTDVDRAKGQALWQTLVSEYSNRNLTFESDRLLALEGVVSALQQHTPLRVIAGVIVDFLPYSLIWH
ncbi:heterokaryon incompatibility protein-domain-containing protein, partial [Dendryphion nanum]